MELDYTPLQSEDLLPWQKPQVRRLVVNMDTRGGKQQPLKAGSSIDGLDMPTEFAVDGF